MCSKRFLLSARPGRSILCAWLFAGVFSSGCAATNSESLTQHDPFEPTNRAIFDFNVKADRLIFKPIAKTYVDVTPAFAREGVHNLVTNLNAPVVLGNNLLQGDIRKGAQTLARFVINTTIGVGGTIDCASRVGLPGNTTDMGVTLGKWGFPEGDYLVLPFVGPLPPRDLLGAIGDAAIDPMTWTGYPYARTVRYARTSLSVVDARAEYIELLEDIEQSSVDFYAATRSLYRQHRNAEIHDGKPDLASLPNF